MGVLHLPHLEMYWQSNCNLIETPGVSSIMSRVRFEQIFGFLHLADNSRDPGINCCSTVRTNWQGFPGELINQNKTKLIEDITTIVHMDHY